MSNFDFFTGSIIASTTSIVADAQNETGAYMLFSGTHAGVTVNFEGTTDGGTTWVALGAYRLDSAASTPLSSSSALSTNGASHWYVMVGACQQFRVRASAWTSGAVLVSIMTVTDADPILAVTAAAGTSSASAALADGFTNPTEGHYGSDGFVYNGATWDRARGNVSNIAVDTSAARTTTGTGTSATNFNHRGAIIQVNVTAATGTTPTLVVKAQGSVDGTNFYDVDATNAATASITTTGQYFIRVYPGLTAAAAGTANQVLPRVWRLAWTIGGTTPSFTFTTTASYIL